MLEDLRIRSLGVIDDATVPLGPGLNVVTGETGAGKTMVVTALGLLLGTRADSSLVRRGSTQARVEADVAVGDDATARRVDDVGGELDDGVVTVARLVSAEGRSRAVAGGASVPVGVLGGLMGDIVVIHGQADQQRLLHPARQRHLLDLAGGAPLAAIRDTFAAAFRRRAEIDDALREIAERGRERAREADLLRFGIGEVTAVAPRPGEDAELLDEEQRLAHADALRRAASEARASLAGEDEGGLTPDALGLVSTARRVLDAERGHDPELAALADALAAASYALADVAADIASYAASVETDPARLAAVSERRAALAGLTRKYGDTVDEVLGWAADAAERLDGLLGDESRAEQLGVERAQVASVLAESGARLTELRVAAAAQLAGRVSDELATLAMGGTRFAVDVSPLAQPTAGGCDEVAFLLEVAGTAPVPVGRGASGGELSRVMLALELCLHDDTTSPTLVFDEVDAGVGGRAAVELGRRLARLAGGTQVVVVTHLPQVAAFADRHLVVTKSSDGAVTSSDVRQLDDEGRLRELSRMLAGLEDSETALAHARELVDLARADRSLE